MVSSKNHFPDAEISGYGLALEPYLAKSPALERKLAKCSFELLGPLDDSSDARVLQGKRRQIDGCVTSRATSKDRAEEVSS